MLTMTYDIPAIIEEVVAGSAQLLDVREIEEWQAGHLAAAKHYPLSEMDLGEDPTPCVDFNKKTYIHCRSGNRVRKARRILEAIGFSEVIMLPVSFVDFKASGAAVIETGV